MISYLGIIGTLLLSICALPEIVKSIRTKQCVFTWSYLLLWGIGISMLGIYTFLSAKSYVLLLNHGINVAYVLIFMYYKVRYNNKQMET